MAKIGYARVSSKEQHLDRQLAALKDVDKLFTDKLSGANTNRPELQKMLAYIREGDIVLVTEDEIRDSMIALIQRNKVVTEGAGALASAALLSGKLDHYIQGRKTVSIISGGNIDLSRVSQITGFVGA